MVVAIVIITIRVYMVMVVFCSYYFSLASFLAEQMLASSASS